jgi:hypothetical protein
MNRRAFFRRTVGAVVGAAVAPHVPLPPGDWFVPTMPLTGLTTLTGLPMSGRGPYVMPVTFSHTDFSEAVAMLDAGMRRRILRILNADLLADGNGPL